nr:MULTISPECIES: hypothetical protein [Mycobacterium]
MATSMTAGAITLGGATAGAESGTTVVLDNYLRRCDFSRVSVAPQVPSPMLGTG